MPLMLDATHQQSAIERDRALREQRLILEETGAHLLDLQRLDLPVETAQLQTLEARWIGSRRVPQRARLEERRGLFERAEHGRLRQPARPAAAHGHARHTVIAPQRDGIAIPCFL